jgi:hypothetical protein
VDEPLLACPSCGERNGTHVDRVEVRAASGQALSVSASGEDGGARLAVEPTALYRGTVGRRHVFVLYVECEICGNLSELIFRQHQGQTILA